jgi:hypothetical protein
MDQRSAALLQSEGERLPREEGVRLEWHFLKAEELVKFKVSSIMASLVRSCDRQPTGSYQGGLS